MLLAESDDAQTLSMLIVPFAFQLWQSPQLKWREADTEYVCAGGCVYEGGEGWEWGEGGGWWEGCGGGRE